MKTYNKLVHPYVVWIALFIVVPMLLIVVYAFSKQGNDVLTLQFTIDNFIRFFQDNVFISVLITSLRIALMTTVICILLGYPAAYLIAKMNVKSSAFFILLITLPMWIMNLIQKI